MCAKDRSQITVLSQTETIHSFSEMLNFSSCPSFIRNTQGEFLHTSPLFDKIFLTSVTSVAWFSALPLKTKIELIQSEIKSFTEDSSVLVRGIGFGDIHGQFLLRAFTLMMKNIVDGFLLERVRLYATTQKNMLIFHQKWKNI